MSSANLIEIFTGRIEPNRCARYVISLKSPEYVKKYLTHRHNVLFPNGDALKNKKWASYPRIEGVSNVAPISAKDLLDNVSVTMLAKKLSFDISRFTEFFAGYTKVDEDIKPIMLHYAVIYLFDFFSRTWLKYGQNWGHGIKITQYADNSVLDTEVKFGVNGIFPRIVDAFYFLGNSSVFSVDDDSGISYAVDAVKGGTASKGIEKIRYSDSPKIRLGQLLDINERLDGIVGRVTISNRVLVGYAVLFVMSSLCRYRAQEWSAIRDNRDLESRFDVLQHDFVYDWMPELLLKYSLERGVQKNIERIGLPS